MNFLKLVMKKFNLSILCFKDEKTRKTVIEDSLAAVASRAGRIQELFQVSVMCDNLTTIDHFKTVINWGLKKTAPFHNGQNSVADAILFLQYALFLQSKTSQPSYGVFVSEDANAFAAGKERKEKNQLHNDYLAYKILPVGFPFQYYSQLASALYNT